MEEVHKKREAERGKGEDTERLSESLPVMPPTGQMPPGLPPGKHKYSHLPLQKLKNVCSRN